MQKLKRWIYKNGGAKDAAILFKCSKTMVYRMMAGEKKPGVNLAKRINKKTGIQLSSLRKDIWKS